MKYMGSKAKISKEILPIIQRQIDHSEKRIYLEPFAGGCNVIDKAKADRRIAADKNEYLVALFQHLQSGGKLPEAISREEYCRVRQNMSNYPKWYVGAVGFMASYNGRFFDGGYAGYGKSNGRVRDYYKESKNNLLNQIGQGGLAGIEFLASDYREHVPIGYVIYCDPPYQGTKQYGVSKDFDYAEFWQLMRDWSRTNMVLISELHAPDDFQIIWEKEVERSMKAVEHFRAREKLFLYAGAINKFIC